MEIFELINGIADKMNSDPEQVLSAVESFAERGWFFLSHSATAYYHRLKNLGMQLNSGNEAGTAVKPDKDCLAADLAAVQLSAAGKDLFLELFAGREGVYGQEELADGKRFYRPVYSPFSLEILEQHLLGEITAGLYIRRHNDTVKVLVIDLDVSKKYLLQIGDNSAAMVKLMQQAHHVAQKVQQVAAGWGLNCYLEDSGYRGRHCWFFLDSPLKPAVALDFFKKLRLAVGISEPVINWECFPAREKFKPDHLGDLIKLPFGIHGKTGRRSLFLQEDGIPFPDQESLLHTIKRCSALRLAAIVKETNLPAEMEIMTADGKTAASASPVGDPGAKQSPQDNEFRISDRQRAEDRLRHLHPLVQNAPQLVRQVITRCSW